MNATLRLLGPVLLLLSACAPNAAATPESWSEEFSLEAVDCGSATTVNPGDSTAVFGCVARSVEERALFEARTDVSPEGGVPDIVEGRVVGLDVEGTFEVFVFNGTQWRGPCQLVGVGKDIHATYVSCSDGPNSDTWMDTENARRFELSVPEAHRGVVPWAQ